MDRTLVLGADGGGTKTLGIVATTDGKEVARHVVGAGNPNVAGVEGAARNLHELIATCCRNGGCRPADLKSTVLGLAGVGSESIRAKLHSALAQLLRDEGMEEQSLIIETDARIGLEGAFGGKYGVVLIAGTGSILIGKIPPGTVMRVGGWGRVLGDEGSGYWIGVEAIKAVAGDLDGRSEAPYLRSILAQRFGWTTRTEIIDAIYQQKFEIPSIAPSVLEGAGTNDPVCRSILIQGAEHLSSHLNVLARKMDTAGEVGVVFIGGLIDHETSYSKILRETISRTLPQAEVRQPLFSPAWGAVIMATNS